MTDKTPLKNPTKVQGEGDHEATRKYDQDQRDFIEANKSEIPKMAGNAKKARETDTRALDEAEAKGKSKARH